MHRVHGRADDSPNASKPPEHSRAVRRSGSAHPAERAWACSWRECSSHGHCARGYEENEEVPRSHGGARAVLALSLFDPLQMFDGVTVSQVTWGLELEPPSPTSRSALSGRGLYPGA